MSRSVTSMARWGAYATASTQNMAFGQRSWRVLARALISWIVPRRLLACVHATMTVLSDSSGERFSGVKTGLEFSGSEVEGSGAHHFMVRSWRSDMAIHEARLAS